MAINLTGLPSVWGDLNLTSQSAKDLSDEQELARKKKIMAAGAAGNMQSATQMLFGNRIPAGASY